MNYDTINNAQTIVGRSIDGKAKRLDEVNVDVTIDNAQTIAGNGEGTFLAGRYRIVRQLGAGGMGSVWLAEDTQLDNKKFAIKMLPSILVANKRAYRQLKEEALVAMRLVHPNIVQIRAFKENNGNPFLVMDYIDGQTLDGYLADYVNRVEHVERVEGVGSRVPRDRDGRARSPSGPPCGGLPEAEVIRILTPIAAALDYAHGEGVVHRDIKPANVIIRKDGHPFVLDFGIAREIQETMTRVTGKDSSGTLLYMSPEQLRGQPPKAAQDVYSFAAMVYECLKGEPPFSRGQIEFQILNISPPPLAGAGTTDGLPVGVNGQAVCSTSLAASVMAGLAKKPEDRPPTCAAVLEGYKDVSRRGAAAQRGVDSRTETAGRSVPTVPKAATGFNRAERVERIEPVRRIVSSAGTVRKPIHNKVQLWAGGPYWAETNIGAEEPWDYGYYFWWGDTIGYKRENDKWVASDGSSLDFAFSEGNTPSCNNGIADMRKNGWIATRNEWYSLVGALFGRRDDGTLTSKYDAAHVHWGGDWRMPTRQELNDLRTKCRWTWTTRKGVNGYTVRGRGDYAHSSIFLPAAGCGNGTSLDYAGSYGYCWSSVPDSGVNDNAWRLFFDPGSHGTSSSRRSFGRSVRPVQEFTKKRTKA